ncbi:MAG TPA: glycosyltransferase family 1 protein [Prolixibacteraceae bacterium]|nr:glycosyltransferase family 1 protein [Prolixibacteraceae bacterium]
MKIGFDAKRAFNNAAGLGNFSRNSITALARQFPDDKYFLFHPGYKKSLFVTPESLTEVKPKHFWWKTLKSVWRRILISRLSKENELDIYHGLSHELPAGIEKTAVKTVVTIHDLIYIRHPEYFHKIDRHIYDLKFRHACRVADRIHAISEQTKRDLITYFAVPEEKIEVIYQAVNPIFSERFDESAKQRIREKFTLPEKFIMTVGTVEPRKNLMALLEGMVSGKINLPLVVVGAPTNYQIKVQTFIETNQNLLNVIFLYEISDSELAILYQMAEVMVYPSVFEGFGLPVAEAEASGCPVITSNTSSLPEAGGDAAIYINPEKPIEIGQALATLLADKDLQKSMIAKGKINAQRFTPEIFAKQLKQLYNYLLNE